MEKSKLIPVSQPTNVAAFCVTACLVTVSADGYSGRPTEHLHQLLLLPVTLLFLASLSILLKARGVGRVPFMGKITPRRLMQGLLAVALVFQVLSAAAYFYEGRRFRGMGYTVHRGPAVALFGVLLAALAFLFVKPRFAPLYVLAVGLASYLGGMVLAIWSFPLNYLRSDMLPVIVWANIRLLGHRSPYQTMYVGTRVYDFPYLPGMLLSYLPAVALHFDVRVVSLVSVLGSAVVIYWAAAREHRGEVAALLAVFLTCPYLQFRHELYNQPYWLLLVVSLVLMLRGRLVVAAIVLGFSMATYQFSWILLPFLLLFGFRTGGWRQAARMLAASVASAAIILIPFASSAYHRITSNTVSQWGLRTHADAEPINLSYWLTYFIRPGQLLRFQAAMLVVIFGFCVVRVRCVTALDTLRWMVISLTLFILTNVLVDGYFYLMLLVPLLLYTCSVNGWVREADPKSMVVRKVNSVPSA